MTGQTPSAVQSSLPPVKAGMRASRPDQASHWSLLIASLVIVLLSLSMSTIGEQKVSLPLINRPLPDLCATRTYLGVDCPGCGLTRSFISLAHGDVARAWHFNPAGLWFFALVVAQIPYRTWQLWRIRTGREPVRFSPLNWALWFLLAALMGQWVVKLVLSAI